jgi:dGTPase
MDNSFYQEFDLQTYGTQRKSKDHRSPFQVDRDRIQFSYPFRRLQSKTQVFQSGEYDFYRTRLTHTIEVARVARSIAEFLNKTSSELSPDYYIDPDLVEAVGLAHDLGHPPFGHIGERKINKLMESFGGFEGNAQTLRILTDLIFEGDGNPYGMHPTRSLLDGVLKYKATQCEWYKEEGNYPDHHFIYDAQEDVRNFVFDGATKALKPFTPKQWNKLKSIECQIMDWADDTAYSLHDIVDGVKAGFIDAHKIEKWASEKDLDSTQAKLVDELCEQINNGSFEKEAARRIGDYINNCELVISEAPLSDLTNRYKYDLHISPEVKARCKIHKMIALELVFKSPALQQIEFKGGHILEKLFLCYKEQYRDPENLGLGILPTKVDQLIAKVEKDKDLRMRILCDYISGLTDSQAIRAYKRLFSADFGSITDLV